MKRHNTILSSNAKSTQDPEPNTNFWRRERVQRCKLATVTIPIVMLFLLALFPQAVTNQDPVLTTTLFLGLGACICALLLTQRGLVRIAGVLTLIVVYAVGTFALLHFPEGLTASDLYLLDLTIIPDILVLAFFPANSILPTACINALQASAVLLLGPHDSTIAHLLQTTPLNIFTQIYATQMVTAIVLYLWANNTERRIAQAEKRERKDWQAKELEHKRQLDAGIQQILQTHVSVANGDLNARAPLLKDHELWQVANSLNNLIARYQSLSHTEHKLRQQIVEENQRSIEQYQHYIQENEELQNLRQTTGEILKLRQSSGEFIKMRQTSNEFPRLRQETSGQFRGIQETSGQFKGRRSTVKLPKHEQDSRTSQEAPHSSL